MKPRYYQREAIDAVLRFLDTYATDYNRHPCVLMPTGTGKAAVIAWLIEFIIRSWPTMKVINLVDVKELVEQNAKTLKRIWPQAPIGIYSAGLGEKTHYMPITFAGIQSARKQAKLFGKVDLVFVDECHMVSPDDEAAYKAFLFALQEANPKIRFVGFSATGYRMGLGMITENGVFTDVCYDITSRKAFIHLVEDGFLSMLVPFQMKLQLNVDKVKKRGGEFVEKDLQQAVVRYDLTYDALTEAIEHAGDRHHWLIYATGIEHVEMICGILDELGISNVPIHSKLSDYERDDNLARHKAGQVKACVNANVLTKGYDFPALDCIILLRPTNSPVLHVQILGRGTRPFYADGFDLETTEGRLAAIAASTKQDCLVLDFAGNTFRLGPINDPKIPKRKGEGSGEMPVKLCPKCDCLNHISAKFCDNPVCDHEFTFEEKITTSASTAQVVVRDEPQVMLFNVDHMTYEKVKGAPGRPPYLRASYYCGKRRFSESVYLEHHHSNIIHKAHKWWRDRSDVEPPMSIDEAQPHVDNLRVPRKIRVWINKKYPDVLAHIFEEEAANV